MSGCQVLDHKGDQCNNKILINIQKPENKGKIIFINPDGTFDKEHPNGVDPESFGVICQNQNQE